MKEGEYDNIRGRSNMGKKRCDGKMEGVRREAILLTKYAKRRGHGDRRWRRSITRSNKLFEILESELEQSIKEMD